MASTYNSVPEHLWHNIFKLIPVKSLLVSRCVCKLWNKVISDDSLIKSHLAHNKTSSNANKYLLVWHEKGDDHDPDPETYINVPYITRLVDSETYSNVVESHIHNMRDIFGRDSGNHGVEVYGICDGLLCLSVPTHILKSDSPIYLWNPVVKKGKKLPPIQTGKYPDIDTCYLCFGYHDGDYKVINIVPYRRAKYQVRVYSLSTNQWSKFRVDNNIGSTLCGNNMWSSYSYPRARLLNGCAYFVHQYNSDQVAFFDISRKIIRQTNLPDDFYFLKMEEDGNSLAVVGLPTVSGDNLVPAISGDDLVMWVLRVSDDSCSWDKKFTIKGKDRHRFFPMGCVGRGKLVLKRFIQVKPYKFEYSLYDVETELKEEYIIPVRPSELEEWKNLRPMINGLTESLVLLNETTTPCTKMQPGSDDATTHSKKPKKRKQFDGFSAALFSTKAWRKV